MAKIKNNRGKMSHCVTKKERDPELIKLWKKKLAKKQNMWYNNVWNANSGFHTILLIKGEHYELQINN